jgi:hypothetical protein
MSDRGEGDARGDSDDEPLAALSRCVRVSGEMVVGNGDEEMPLLEDDEVVEEEEVEVVEDDGQGPKRTPLVGEKEKPEWTKGPHIVAEVEALMTKRGDPYYLVRWEGLPAAAKTWEAGACFKGRGAVALGVFLTKKVCMRA